MGLTSDSTGFRTHHKDIAIKKNAPSEKLIAIAGNPNVGKSTLFNELTGLHQHTGNWTGKTISNAWGKCHSEKNDYLFVDIPGTYSLLAHSQEEEIARNFLCFEAVDACIVVCDATCLERGMNLLLQIMEIVPKVLLCINLVDEADRKHIRIDMTLLSDRLGIPVVGTTAHSHSSKKTVLDALDSIFSQEISVSNIDSLTENSPVILYEPTVEQAIAQMTPVLEKDTNCCLPARWLGLQLLLGNKTLLKEVAKHIQKKADICAACAGCAQKGHCTGTAAMPAEHSSHLSSLYGILSFADETLHTLGLTKETLTDSVVSSITHRASFLCQNAVIYECRRNNRDSRIDKILTSRLAGYPLMIALLLLVFWITIVGANYPSSLLSAAFTLLEEKLNAMAATLHFAPWLQGLLIQGIFRTVSWIVSVMLPPMAIFFPLFTLLEDIGYLPRIAYNLDYHLKKCRSCGKQALTMAMGFGCNAAGVVGCRIIDSPRERLIAILTNSFVPCNGRFPTLIAMITMFVLSGNPSSTGKGIGMLLASFCLTALILLGVYMTFIVSRILSNTLLKGIPSSFTLELPPFRRPQIGKIVVRSILDRTLFLLSRAVIAAVPAGLLIWFMANLHLGSSSLLSLCSSFLDPFARLLGLDGTILMAFILGLPANEIVLPIILMAYSSQGSLQALAGYDAIKSLLVANGWDVTTAVSVCLFSLMHWPCATTLLTIKKETGSIKWTFLSILVPLFAGILCCMLFHAAVQIF